MKGKYKIGFLMYNEHSSFNAAFGLASVLQERGHKVIFFVKAGSVFPQYVAKNGFDSAIMENQNIGYHKKNTKFRPWTRLKNHARRMNLDQNCFADLIAKDSLDLCFLDSIYSYPYAAVLVKMRIPTILLFYTYGSRLKTLYPPVFSTMIPLEGREPNILQRFVYCILWFWTITTRGRTRSYEFVETINWVFRRIFRRIYQVGFENQLRKLGWKSSWSEWSIRPIVPEIVFGHRSLDWHAVASNPERCYFGTTDFFRKDSDFDWSEIESKGPIIYCNVSTAHGFEHIRVSAHEVQSSKIDFSRKKFRIAKRFIEIVTDTFSRRKEWQLILACGPFYRTLQNDSLPANIHIFERVPQLAVLARANLAITWGGAGTIRECINFGVPMLVFPAWTDQFGNAARVSFHNVGLQGDIIKVSSKKMIELVERVLTDKTIQSSVEEMQRQCDATKEIQNLVNFVRCYTAIEL